MKEKIISALVGLCGAASNNGTTEETDRIMVKALAAYAEGWSDSEYEELFEEIHKVKFSIAPDCATCQHPCGNTSDYNMKLLENAPDDIKKLKTAIINRASEMALSMLHYEKSYDTGLFYRAVAYFGYDLEADVLKPLLDELKEKN